MAMSEVNFCGD